MYRLIQTTVCLFSKMLTKFSRFTKLTVVTFVALFTALSTILLVGAQEQVQYEEIGLGVTQEIGDPALGITLKMQPVQEYPSKKFAMVLTIDSKIDSDRVGVQWNYENGYFIAEGGKDNLLKVRNGQQTTLTK